MVKNGTNSIPRTLLPVFHEEKEKENELNYLKAYYSRLLKERIFQGRKK